MRVGCNTVNFRPNVDLDFALEKIAAAGYEYVEVEANRTWCSHADPWKDDPIKFREKIKSYGFKGVAALGSQREIITSEEGVKDIKRALEWAKEAGIPIVLTGEGRVPEGMSIKTALDIIKRRFVELLEVAERCKVYLAIEDHGTISLTPDGLPTLLGLVDSEWLGVNFDTANIHRGNYIGTDSEGYKWRMGKVTSYDEVELIKKVAHRVKHVHFKDVIGLEPVTLGQGEIDLMGCLRALNEVGSDAVLAYETEGCEDKEKAYEMIVESKKWVENALKNL